MGLRKRIADKAVDRRGRFPRKSVESFDHWAFLEEIEAPMWVDFLEDQVMHNDIDDDWFQTVHRFHQFSSYHITSSYPLLSGGEVKTSETLSLSPEVPGSVSRARGNHCRSRRWEQIGQVSVLRKQHPIKVLGGKASSGNRRRNLTRKAMPNSSVRKPVTTSRNVEGSDPKASSSSECTSTSRITLKSPGTITKASLTYLKGNSLPNSGLIYESNQQSSGLELPNCTGDHTSRLLSSITSNLPSGHVIRHALRVEVTEGWQKHDKSSRSKSSVGSSSNTECNLKANQLAANKRIPNAKNYRRPLHPTNSKVSCVWKTEKKHLPDRELSLNLKQGLGTAVAKPICQEEKSKALHCTRPQKPLRPCKVENASEEKVVAKSKKPKSSQKVSVVATLGKENSLSNADHTQKALTGIKQGKDFDGLFNVKPVNTVTQGTQCITTKPSTCWLDRRCPGILDNWASFQLATCATFLAYRWSLRRIVLVSSRLQKLLAGE